LAALLRASGPQFDVNAFVADCGWKIARVFHRGEVRLPKARPAGFQHEQSGLNVVVSEADLDQFAQQLKDASDFLTESASEVRRLVAFPGVTGVVLDFGIAWQDVIAPSDYIPAELVRLAGACGIALELSHYPVSESKAPGE
jgi:hypothetical protein